MEKVWHKHLYAYCTEYEFALFTSWNNAQHYTNGRTCTHKKFKEYAKALSFVKRAIGVNTYKQVRGERGMQFNEVYKLPKKDEQTHTGGDNNA